MKEDQLSSSLISSFEVRDLDAEFPEIHLAALEIDQTEFEINLDEFEINLDEFEIDLDELKREILSVLPGHKKGRIHSFHSP